MGLFEHHWILVLLYWDAKEAYVFQYGGPQLYNMIEAELKRRLALLAKTEEGEWQVTNALEGHEEQVCAQMDNCECWEWLIGMFPAIFPSSSA